MSKLPFGRLRAVAAAGVVVAGFSALPASASLPNSVLTTGSSPAFSSASTALNTTTGAISSTAVVRSETFVNSVGVGVHLKQRHSSYLNYASVKKALLNLGIHHIRDNLSWDARKYLDLNRAGIKVSATVPRGADTDAELTKVIDNAKQWRPALSSIGGPNEYETTVTGWASKLESFQSRLFKRVNSVTSLKSVPVLGPSLRTATDETLLGNISQYLDMGAIHAYPYGQTPEADAAAYVKNARITSGSKPIVVSETGMSNASDALRRQYNLPYSERAAGIYTPRLVLEYFRLGVKKTYLYQLLNEDNVGSLVPRNRYFGLLNKDFSPKPSFIEMRTLLKALADNGNAFTTRGLSYSISSGSTLRKMLFEKSNGTYYIAVWRPVSVWQSGGATGHDLYPSSVRATLNLPFAASSVQVIDLRKGLTPVKTVRGAAHVQLDVLPSVQLVKVTR